MNSFDRADNMQGLMMQQPLLVTSLLTHAERHHGGQEIVSRRVEGDIHRYQYRDLAQRARRMANALANLNIAVGERVAILAWNGYRHMELYFAVSGAGAVLHTLNPRLHVDQLAYIVEHAEDRVVFFDLTFLPLIQSIARRVKSPKHFVAMVDRARMPENHELSTTLLCYEDLIDGHSDAFDWPVLDENSASSLCYTSGTTGNPKGVLYSHRSTLLHTYAAALPDSLNCSARDVILPVVPMFHVNAWGLPYIACMVGAKLVFPGPALDGKSLHALIEGEQVTLSAGVPTVWQGLLAHVDAISASFSSMNRTIIGGAPCPTAMTKAFQERHRVDDPWIFSVGLVRHGQEPGEEQYLRFRNGVRRPRLPVQSQLQDHVRLLLPEGPEQFSESLERIRSRCGIQPVPEHQGVRASRIRQQQGDDESDDHLWNPSCARCLHHGGHGRHSP